MALPRRQGSLKAAGIVLVIMGYLYHNVLAAAAS
jgi:hypothetical protein